MPNILMLTPDNEEIEVPEEHFEAATQRDKFEPAFEYMDPKTKQPIVVRKSHAARAEKDGLVAKPVWDAQNTKIEPSKIGAGEAAARGFANAATLGFADEASAGINALGSAVKKGTLEDLGTDYSANRENYRTQDDAAWDQQGLAYGAGYGGASAASLASGVPKLFGSSAAQLSTMAPKAIAARGAVEGGVGALGGGTDLEGQPDLLEGEFGRAALQTGVGAATGGLIGGLGQKVAQSAAPALREGAERAAYRSTGGMKSDINKIYAHTPQQVGRNMLDEGMVPVLGQRAGDEIQGRVQGRLNDLRVKQDQFFEGLDAMASEGVPFEAIERKMVERIKEAEATPGQDNTKFANALRVELEDLRKKLGVGVPQEAGPLNVTPKPANYDQMLLGGSTKPNADQVKPVNLSFRQALDAKRGMDKGGKYATRTEASSVEAARESRKILKDAIDEAIAASEAGPEAMKAYKADRNKSKLLLDALSGLEQENQRQLARKQVFGLTDTIAGGSLLGTGMAAGMSTPATAALTLGGLAAKKGIETYGDAFSARTMDAAAKIIDRYGFDEGMKRITQALGPDAAAQIGIKIGERKK